MKIKALVLIYGKMGPIKDKPLAEKEAELEIGDGFSREEIEAELVKINKAANEQPVFSKALRCEMVLTEIEGKPV